MQDVWAKSLKILVRILKILKDPKDSWPGYLRILIRIMDIRSLWRSWRVLDDPWKIFTRQGLNYLQPSLYVMIAFLILYQAVSQYLHVRTLRSEIPTTLRRNLPWSLPTTAWKHYNKNNSIWTSQPLFIWLLDYRHYLNIVLLDLFLLLGFAF